MNEPSRPRRPDAPGVRVFRLLLGFYPASFREQYGTDAVELFVDQHAESRARGLRFVVWLWVKTVPNVIMHGLLERIAVVRSTPSGSGRDTLRAIARRLVRAPAFASVIVLTLGLGIGANVALYSVLHSVLLRPLPYPEAEELVQLWETNPEVSTELYGPSPWNFADWETEVTSLRSMAAWYLTSGTYRTGAWVEELRSAQVTPDFFRTLGVEPLLGRDFDSDEVDTYGPVMLSHGVWTRLFGQDPSVIGRTVISSGNSYSVVGVMPPDFTFPDPSVETWVAWSLPAVYADQPESRTWRFLNGIGRLEEGVAVSQAEEELDRIAAGLSETWPEMNRGWDVAVTSLHEDIVGDVRPTLWIALGAVLFILLIACANVANLLLARVPARKAEIGLRSVLGASRSRLAWEIALEHLALGVLAVVAGLAIGAGMLELLVMFDAGRIPRLEEVSIGGPVLLFTALVGVVTTLAFGSAPLVQLVGSVRAAGRAGGGRSTGGPRERRVREAFVGTQLAVALVLLVGAGLFTASLRAVVGVDPGFEPEGVATLRVSLDPIEGTRTETVQYYRDLENRLREVPGVVAVGSAQTLPLNPVANDFRRPYRPLGTATESADAATVQMRIVTPEYVEAMGMRVLEGRAIPESAIAGDPLVAVVNRTLADRLFPEGDAVGASFEIDFREGWQPYTIVGVVQDVRHYGPRADPLPEVFLAHAQVPYIAMSVAVRTETDPRALATTLAAAVLEVRSTQPAHNFVAMEDLLVDSTAEERFLSGLFALFGAVGLLLATTGVYGVIAYSVSHRRREIGVRMALGADRSRVVRSVLRDGLVMTGVGLTAGAIGVLALAPVVEGLLYGVPATSPGALVSVILLLGGVAAVASWLPARRAAHIAPGEALRAE